jgi:hypothetical protein
MMVVIAGGHGPRVGVVPRAQSSGEPVEIVAGAVELLGPRGRGGGRAGAGVHEHPPQLPTRGPSSPLPARDMVSSVTRHAPRSAGVFTGVAFGDVVHLGGHVEVEGGQLGGGDVMSQCNRDTSIPNAEIARAPTDPTMWSHSGAIASNARAIRSSLSADAGISNVSSTAQASAQSLTRHIGVGALNRLATNASITCPCDTIATSRTGHARSTIPARSNRRQYWAITGNARRRCPRARTTEISHHRANIIKAARPDHLNFPHARKTGLARHPMGPGRQRWWP